MSATQPQRHLHVSNQKPILHLDCLSHVYSDGTVGAHDLCFKVFEKEVVTVCGPNGAGKSTLLEHLNGILLPTDGEIILNGEKVSKKTLEKLRKAVGLVFQDADSQLIAPTVLDDVMFGPMNNGLSLEEAKEAAEWALGMVGFDQKTRIPHYLSGGEKRLVAIAGVIAMKPKIVAVDEPTSDLDPLNAERIELLLKKLRDELALSVVISTHDVNLAARVSDRIYVLKKGSVLAEGDPRDLFYDDALLKDANLKPPQVVNTYRMLVEEGVLNHGHRPVTEAEMLNLLRKKQNEEFYVKVK